MRTYSTPDVAKIVGLEYRTLHSWVQRGLVVPSQGSNGTGHPAEFTEDDVRRVAALARLRRAGCGMEILQAAVEAPIIRGRVKLEFEGVKVEVSCAR